MVPICGSSHCMNHTLTAFCRAPGPGADAPTKYVIHSRTRPSPFPPEPPNNNNAFFAWSIIAIITAIKIGPAVRARPSPVYGACQMKGVLLKQYSNCPLLFKMQKQRKYPAKYESRLHFEG